MIIFTNFTKLTNKEFYSCLHYANKRLIENYYKKFGKISKSEDKGVIRLV